MLHARRCGALPAIRWPESSPPCPCCCAPDFRWRRAAVAAGAACQPLRFATGLSSAGRCSDGRERARRNRRTESCFPPEHHVVEVPALLFWNQRHYGSTGGFPDVLAVHSNLLAFAVL